MESAFHTRRLAAASRIVLAGLDELSDTEALHVLAAASGLVLQRMPAHSRAIAHASFRVAVRTVAMSSAEGPQG